MLFGVALNAETQTRVSQHDAWNFYQASVRVDVPVLSGQVVSLDVAPDLTPLAWTTRDPTYGTTTPAPCSGTCLAADVPAVPRVVRRTAVAFGAAPLAAALHVNRHRLVELILDARAGALWFSRAMPDPDAARLNFTLAAGFGFCFAQRLLIGYAYQHMSNAGTAPINPGVDTHVLYGGITIAR